MSIAAAARVLAPVAVQVLAPVAADLLKEHGAPAAERFVSDAAAKAGASEDLQASLGRVSGRTVSNFADHVSENGAPTSMAELGAVAASSGASAVHSEMAGGGTALPPPKNHDEIHASLFQQAMAKTGQFLQTV